VTYTSRVMYDNYMVISYHVGAIKGLISPPPAVHCH
jgi:hypothetical protein